MTARFPPWALRSVLPSHFGRGLALYVDLNDADGQGIELGELPW